MANLIKISGGSNASIQGKALFNAAQTPTYNIGRSLSAVNEGSSVTFTLSTFKHESSYNPKVTHLAAQLSNSSGRFVIGLVTSFLGTLMSLFLLSPPTKLSSKKFRSFSKFPMSHHTDSRSLFLYELSSFLTCSTLLLFQIFPAQQPFTILSCFIFHVQLQS